MRPHTAPPPLDIDVASVRMAFSLGMFVSSPGFPTVVTSAAVGFPASAAAKSDWFASVPVIPPHTAEVLPVPPCKVQTLVLPHP